MASIFTIQGAGTPDKCKRVHNKRTGCSMLLCNTGHGKTGWQFQKGSSECSRTRTKRKKERR
jgi:hypothetical protein